MIRCSAITWINKRSTMAKLYRENKNRKLHEPMFIEFVRYYDLIKNKWIASDSEIKAINDFINR